MKKFYQKVIQSYIGWTDRNRTNNKWLMFLLVISVYYFGVYKIIVPTFQDYLSIPIKVKTVTREAYAKTPNAEDYKYIPSTVKEKIEMAALEANIGVDEALAVANCESRLNPKNKSRISTAKGVYQFLNGTWANYCEGDVLNEDDNIKCFMQVYHKHKAWWECAKILNYTK